MIQRLLVDRAEPTITSPLPNYTLKGLGQPRIVGEITVSSPAFLQRLFEVNIHKRLQFRMGSVPFPDFLV